MFGEHNFLVGFKFKLMLDRGFWEQGQDRGMQG